MLLRPLLIAGAVGFAVSAAQYVPTLFAGGGRFMTLATEALSLCGRRQPAHGRRDRLHARGAAAPRLRARARRAGLALSPPPRAASGGAGSGHMSEVGLRLEALDLSVGGRALLAGFSLQVAPGEVTTVMGPSGCGKSSLLS